MTHRKIAERRNTGGNQLFPFPVNDALHFPDGDGGDGKA